MSEDSDYRIRGGSQNDQVVEADKPKTKQPPLYKVVVVNDDFTPMEFVVQVLQQFFHHTRESAVQIMLHDRVGKDLMHHCLELTGANHVV